MIAPYSASSLVNLFKPENKSHFRLINDHNFNRLNVFLMNSSILVTICSNMFTSRDCIESFKLDGDVLKTMTN